MSVYVDSLRTWIGEYRDNDAARIGGRNNHQWCHLFADEESPKELHVLALRIGMYRKWFQGNHYDLTPAKRAAAIRAGAIEVNRMQAAMIWRKQR